MPQKDLEKRREATAERVRKHRAKGVTQTETRAVTPDPGHIGTGLPFGKDVQSRGRMREGGEK